MCCCVKRYESWPDCSCRDTLIWVVHNLTPHSHKSTDASIIYENRLLTLYDMDSRPVNTSLICKESLILLDIFVNSEYRDELPQTAEFHQRLQWFLKQYLWTKYIIIENYWYKQQNEIEGSIRISLQGFWTYIHILLNFMMQKLCLNANEEAFIYICKKKKSTNHIVWTLWRQWCYQLYVISRGSYMSAHVLLLLLNELG